MRAQAVDADGRLLDDFAIIHTEGAIHVCNAPSPGATTSLMIGKRIADMAEEADPALAGWLSFRGDFPVTFTAASERAARPRAESRRSPPSHSRR